MHDYKIYAPVTPWPPGIFIGRNGNFSAPIHYQTDILTFETPSKNHGYILGLNKLVIAWSRVYLNCSSF